MKRFNVNLVRGVPLLAEDPAGAIIKFPYKPDVAGFLLGRVRHAFYDHVTGTIRLKVAHFNGEDWPIDPPAFKVEVI